MKGLLSLTSLFFLLLFGSCSGNKQTKVKEINVANTSNQEQVNSSHRWIMDSISHSSEGSYWYYVPTIQGSAPTNCFILFDPHGKAKYPISLYKHLAQTYGVVLVASTKTKNGMSISETRIIAQQLIQTVRNSFENRINITLVGFSGGARVAFDAALAENGKVNLVYSGAAGNINNYNFRMLGFAGNADMNYSELLNFDKSMAENSSHFLIETNEKHAWPSVENMELAFLWTLSPNHLKPESYFETKARLYQSAQKQPLLLQKINELELVQLLCWNDSSTFEGKTELHRLKSSKLYLAAERKKLELLNQESKAKEYYSNAFFEKDFTWWKNEVQNLRKHTQPEIDAMNQRLLGFFSLASYSIVHQAVKANNFEAALRILDIYELVDPENNEPSFVRAICFCHQNRTEESLVQLEKSVQLGFQDMERLQSEPCFQSLKSNPTFEQLNQFILKNGK